MSTVIPCTDCTSISNFPTVGFGNDFKGLKKFYDGEMMKWRRAETLGRLDQILLSIDELCGKCSEEGWDGYDAFPITEEVCDEAKRLIKSLPINFPMPEIVPEPSGEIGFEWSRGDRLVFVASVSGKNEIIYAGLFGSNKVNGIEYFGESIPLPIAVNLKRLYLKG